MIWKSVLPYARSGIFGAVILGLGQSGRRDHGSDNGDWESDPKFHLHFFPEVIRSLPFWQIRFFEASGKLFVSSIIEICLVLFLLAFVINMFARFLIWRMTRGRTLQRLSD